MSIKQVLKMLIGIPIFFGLVFILFEFVYPHVDGAWGWLIWTIPFITILLADWILPLDDDRL